MAYTSKDSDRDTTREAVKEALDTIVLPPHGNPSSIDLLIQDGSLGHGPRCLSAMATIPNLLPQIQDALDHFRVIALLEMMSTGINKVPSNDLLESACNLVDATKAMLPNSRELEIAEKIVAFDWDMIIPVRLGGS